MDLCAVIAEVLVVKKLVVSFLLALFMVSAVLPTEARAGGHASSFNLNLSIRSGGFYGPRPFYPYRPVCPIGGVGPGCFAPVRRAGWFAGRLAFGLGRRAFWAGFRAVRFTGRVLFGRPYWW